MTTAFSACTHSTRQPQQVLEQPATETTPHRRPLAALQEVGTVHGGGAPHSDEAEMEFPNLNFVMGSLFNRADGYTVQRAAGLRLIKRRPRPMVPSNPPAHGAFGRPRELAEDRLCPTRAILAGQDNFGHHFFPLSHLLLAARWTAFDTANFCSTWRALCRSSSWSESSFTSLSDVYPSVQAADAPSPANHDLLGVVKGARNGIVYGCKVRFPHALVMAALFSHKPWPVRIHGILTATRNHALALGKFVTIYKIMMLIQKRLNGGKERDLDTLIAGGIGGWWVFSDRTPVSTASACGKPGIAISPLRSGASVRGVMAVAWTGAPTQWPSSILASE